jgi:EmrB/QacA subfamily drug resistance transporter
MTKQQKLVLVVSILASFVAFLDGAIVNVALPAIREDLGGGLASQQWVVDAYLITLGSLILLAGSLSDLLGRKKILTIGLWGFGAASILCAISPSIGFLIASRALQGLAGALLVPSSLAIIISTFSGVEQGKAIGTWTAWTGMSFIIGPLVGGFLVDSASWRWIFAINVLPIAVTLGLIKRIEAKDPVKSSARIDLVGAVLCALGLASAVFALIEQPAYSWGSPIIFLPLIFGLLLMIAFLIYESKTESPMLPLSIFKNHNFSVGNVATLAIYASLTATTFLVVVFLQQVAGYSALKAGMALVPVTLIMFFLSSRFGTLSGKYGPRAFMTVGPIIAGIGFLLMLRIDASADYVTQVLPGVALFGLGLSVTVAPLTHAILGDVDKSQSGIASAINNAVARIAGLLAVAAVGAIVAAQFSSALDQKIVNNPSTPVPESAVVQAKEKPLSVDVPAGVNNEAAFKSAMTDASVSAFHTGILFMAVLIMAGGVISAIGIRNPKPAKS